VKWGSKDPHFNYKQLFFNKERFMLYWAVIFLVIALISGALGLTNVAVISGEISKVLFIIFVILFVIALLFGLAII
jgi:uncharacterized membrane protein YtjA (UPF0391 family)